jgi:hypothetical protein
MAVCRLCGGSGTIQIHILINVPTGKPGEKPQPKYVLKTVRCTRCGGSGRED